MTDLRHKLLCANARTQTIHDLSAVETLCLNALAGEKKYPGGLNEFHSALNPAMVLDLVRVVKSALSDEELQELGKLIEELTTYVKVVPDENGASRSASRAELVLRARQLRSMIGI